MGAAVLAEMPRLPWLYLPLPFNLDGFYVPSFTFINAENT